MPKLDLGEEITIEAWEKETESFKSKGGQEQTYYYLKLKDEKGRYTTSENIGEQLRSLKLPAHVIVEKDGHALSLRSV